MNKALTLAGMLSVFAALPAGATDMCARNHNKMLNHMMMKMDADRDGFISEDEHQTAAERMFIRADKNDDGYLSKQEVADHGAQMRKEAGMPLYSEATEISNPHPHRDR
jgi:hypothetical protein